MLKTKIAIQTPEYDSMEELEINPQYLIQLREHYIFK